MVGGGGGRRVCLADLPGLIEDAHKGRGLGREFLRHLRRTRAMVVVVDASQSDPFADYIVVREELRMYNPQYVLRPHVVALNKCDLPGVSERVEDLKNRIKCVLFRLHFPSLRVLYLHHYVTGCTRIRPFLFTE